MASTKKKKSKRPAIVLAPKACPCGCSNVILEPLCGCRCSSVSKELAHEVTVRVNLFEALRQAAHELAEGTNDSQARLELRELLAKIDGELASPPEAFPQYPWVNGGR